MVRKRPTSADVAELAGVSRTTVSIVLNRRPDIQISPATRQRVFDAAQQLGYHPSAPAQQLAGGAAQTIGLVLRQSPEQIAGDAFLPATLRGLSTAARVSGFRVLVESLPPGLAGYAELLRSHRTDGLVVSGPRSDDASLAELEREGFPLVLQGHLPGLEVPSVDVDNVAGARLAVQHLLDIGHEAIACVTNAPLAYTSAAERLAGYREALESAGSTVDERLIAEGNFDAASGHAAIESLLARSVPFTAVFVASDVVALGALGAIRGAGLRVPADLSVVGFDDIPLAAFFDPPLTTVRLPAFDLGVAAGEAILERIDGRTVPARTLLGTELIVRMSDAPPGARNGPRSRGASEPGRDPAPAGQLGSVSAGSPGARKETSA